MNAAEHEQLQSLLGAYSLHATSAVEARRIERHLGECDECAHELRLLRETAAELAWLPEPEEAAAVIERISGRLPKRSRRPVSRIAVAVAVASTAAAAVFGTVLVRERSHGAAVKTVLATASRRVALQPQGGFEATATLHLARERAALAIGDLPRAGKDRSYQLWAIVGTKPRSMTVFGGGGRDVIVFAWRGRADRFAVTIEPEGGSPIPTTDPVLAGA